MNDNKNPQQSSDELLDLISRYSDANKSQRQGTAESSEAPAAAPRPAAQPSKPVSAVPVKQKAVPISPRHNHYTEPEDNNSSIRFAPEVGHFTDDGGNAVDDPTEQEEGFADVHFSGDETPDQKARARAKAKTAYRRAKRRNREKRAHGSITVTLVKALVYTACVLLLAFFTAFGFSDFWPGIIPMANDVFAFVKSGNDVTVTITDDMTTEEVASLLCENGIIDEEKVYKFYVKYKFDENNSLDEDSSILSSVMHLFGDFCNTMFFGDEIEPENDVEYIPGDYVLNSGMNYDQIISAITTVPYSREEVTVTIPEGYTVDEIIDLLVSYGIGDREQYVYAINNYPYKHEFVRLLEENGYNDGRIYRLEGYLYPDTYIFYRDTDEVEVINKMLNTFSTRVWSEYYTTYKPVCEELGFTFDEMVTFASVVQAEGKSFADFECISQVFHNRFNSAEFDKMESCAALQYVIDIERSRLFREEGVYVERVFNLTAEHLAIDTPYNTYMYSGLPAGAVCNPGLDAFEAALYPDMSQEIKAEFNLSTAYYFNSDMAGNIYYAQTPYQHSINTQKAEKVNEQIQNGTYTEDGE